MWAFYGPSWAGKARAELPGIVRAIKGRRKGYGRQAAGYDGRLMAAGRAGKAAGIRQAAG